MIIIFDNMGISIVRSPFRYIYHMLYRQNIGGTLAIIWLKEVHGLK